MNMGSASQDIRMLGFFLPTWDSIVISFCSGDILYLQTVHTFEVKFMIGGIGRQLFITPCQKTRPCGVIANIVL